MCEIGKEETAGSYSCIKVLIDTARRPTLFGTSAEPLGKIRMSGRNEMRCFVNVYARAVLIWLAVLSVAAVSPASALEKEAVHDRRLDADYSMVGIRLGAWSDQGGGVVINDNDISADLPGTSFFSELFYDHRFTPAIMGEFSLGVGSRGEATIRRFDDEYIGNINLYPLLVQLKFTPLSGKMLSFHPYLTAGGGVVFGRYSPQIIRSLDPYYDQYFVEKTEADFLATVGGGIDLALAEQFGLNVSVKYYPIKFTDGLAGVKDYTGLSIAVGFAYHVFKSKN